MRRDVYQIVTFGSVIAKARKGKGLNLRDCASMILKEDETPISYQYLSDLENNRRNPSDYVIEQIASVLNIPVDVLYFHADRYPADINKQVSNEVVVAAFRSFRARLSPK